MKKFKHLSLLLCMCFLMQCLSLPAAAAETTEAQTDTQTAAAVRPAEEVPFGSRCIQNGCRTIEGMVPLGGTDRKLETAQGVFLFEMNTGTVVYSYNPDLKLAPGGLTKIVTAIVALQHCDLDEIVTVKTGIKGRLPVSNLDIDLTGDEQISVEALLHALLLKYANDAAVVLAEHIAGNSQGYVTLMNNWVKQIGCTNTEFASVHGVDGAQSVTTARDIAKIVRAAIQDEEFKEIFGATEYTIGATNMSEERAKLQTSNYMRDNSVIQDFYDNRVTGGIQSYEASSGACLTVTAESGGLNYIGVVLGCTRTLAANGWQPIVYGNFEEMENLLKFGFNNFKINRIVYEGMSLSQFSVAGGECNAVGQAKVDIDSVVPINAQMKNLTMSFDLGENGLVAPISAGEQIGTVSISYLNSVMAEAEVYAMGSVRASNDTGVTIRSTAIRSDSDASGALSVIGTICVIVLGLAAGYLAFNAYMRSRMRARRRKRRAQRRRMR